MMVSWLGLGLTKEEAVRRRVAQHLKRCPLCDTLNAVRNAECVCCRWAGAFEHNPELVEESFQDLLQRCPELADAFPEADRPAKPPLWIRARHWLRRLMLRRRRLNFTV